MADPDTKSVTLSGDIVRSINDLAGAQNLGSLTAQNVLGQLRTARTLAQSIQGLPAIDADLQTLRAEHDAQETALREAQQQVQNHLRTIAVLTETAGAADRAAPAGRGDKISDPDKFDGTRAKLRPFLGQLRLKVGDRTRYPTDQDRLRYAANRLEGPALDQILPTSEMTVLTYRTSPPSSPS
jgi:hypothetical protein